MSSRHQQPDLFDRRHLRIDFAGDSSFMNDQQPIGKTRHFFELRGDKQDRAPSITQSHQLPVNKLDRADINAASRLRHEQQLWIDVILAPDDQLLLIATGKSARGKCGVWWTNVKLLNDLIGASLNRVVVKKNSAGESSDRRTIMHSEDRILCETEIEQQSASMPIFRNVSDAELAPHARAHAR